MSHPTDGVDYVIEREYRCVFYYDFEYDEKSEESYSDWHERTHAAFEKFIFKLERTPKYMNPISVCTTSAGPAWSAYFDVTSPDWKALDSFMKRICRELKRLGGKIMEG